MKTLVIDTQAIRHNISVVKERVRSLAIYGVLTGDAYGVGLLEAARLLRENGIGRFAVTEPKEATALRKSGFSEEEILMLRSTARREELEELLDANAVCTVGSHEAGMALDALAKERSTAVEAHLLIDTGIGYGGFPASESEKILSIYQYLPHVALSGLYTTLCSVQKQKDKHMMQTQLKRLSSVVSYLQEAGCEPGIVHASCAFSSLRYPMPPLDAIQVGSSFFGQADQRGRDNDIGRVAYVQTTISEISWLSPGQAIGEEHPIYLKKPTKVAVIPVGYLNGMGVRRQGKDGFLRTLADWRAARQMTVKVGQHRARILGRPGMTETYLDVTHLECATGATVSFSMEPQYARDLPRTYR